VRALSVEQIATRLIERFDLLREESSSTLPQHQTLQAAMDWSYQLISPQEQCLLQRLSVFVGGWPLEAAEALGSDLQTPPAPSSAPSIAPLAPQEIFHLLTSLIDKSLVIAETHNKEARYRLLETVREYSLEKLSRASQVMALRDRHLDFFLKLLDHAMTEIRGPKQSEWITRIALEYGNIQSALHWAKKSPELGLRLAISLMRFWEVQGYYKEGQEWLEKFAAYLEAPSLWRARALSCAGIFARLQCDYATAYQLFGQSLALREAINDRRGIAEVLNNRGLVAYNEGNYEKASADFEKSLAIKHEFGDKLAIANSLVNLGMVAKEKADYASAQAYYEQCLSLRQEVGDQFGIADALHSLAIIFYEQSAYLDAQTFCQQSLAIRRKLNNRLGIAMSLNQLGMIAAAQSEHTRARALYEESLAIKCELGDKRGSANTLNNLGLVAHDAGDYNAAASYYQKSLATKREIGDQHGIANTLHNLGVLALDQQKCTDASSLLKESLLIRRQVGDKQGIAKSLEGFARLQHRHSQLEAAVQLLGAAEALREAIHSPIEAKERRELEAAIRLICEALGENNFQREISKGRNLTLEQAIECALAFQI
jgi:tetratricopeptide (TPR) repeat protein